MRLAVRVRKNVPTGAITRATDVAALSTNGVKHVYTLQNGMAYEAASDNGWKNAATGTVTDAQRVAAANEEQ